MLTAETAAEGVPGTTGPRAPGPARGARRLVVPVPPAPRRGHLPLGEPAGTPDRIEVTSGWFERAGRPWFPVSGEVHYARVPRERWSDVLGHARAGGLDSVATYVLWQAHEPEPGVFRWDGDRDLRAFVLLAARHGLDVVVRIGPWAHGEARHGGFPDWLVGRDDVRPRTDDPAYLALVRRLYAETAAQLEGLSHTDGGPVVGVQVDNELYDQPGHLATLRRTAEELGLRVPLWTATGWGGAQVPGTLLPVYSAYPDGFWEETTTGWPPFAPVHFRYSSVRDDLSVGADLREALDGVVLDPAVPPRQDDDALPYATCELGGGMHVAYHRRPLVQPLDVAALALAKIGSGSVWQGYYMYAGGTQRVGAHGTEQESQATGYPNDVPTRTYDFHAPIGEHGQVRPHHHALRRQHLWLAADAALAAMPATIGGGGEDPEELRWSVRSDGHRGYLFLTTYQPAHTPLPPQPGVQVEVVLGGTPLTVPSAPVDLPAGVSVVWPLRLPLTDALVLRSATAGLLTRLDAEDAADATGDVDPLVVLVATDGVPVELVLEGDVPVGGAGRGAARDGTTVVTLADAPGPGTVVRLPGVRVLVVDEASADRLHRLHLGGRDRLVLADAPVHAEDGALVAHPTGPVSSVSVLPAPARLVGEGVTPAASTAPWTTWTLTTPDAGARRLVADLHPVAPAPPAPTRGGPMDRLAAPTDLSGAARVDLAVPDALLADVDRALLRITWTGDVGRLLVGEEVVGDHFWHGRVWDVDLAPWRDEVRRHGVRLELLPWRRATGVWVDPSVRDVPDGITVAAVDVVRVPRVVVTLED
ncbi:beta-galactosidase [Cellulomonas endophytica]|uniref:beta-galactosidase n=1 Tax=Cellulomonas endophytica TaxID=2494735 RepID=UPI001012938A|nr:beta-galactosidase [Cellulomonas endophytica]